MEEEDEGIFEGTVWIANVASGPKIAMDTVMHALDRSPER
jgi:hypothetical protein